MIYKRHLLLPVEGKRIDKKSEVKVYTPKRNAYKIPAEKGIKIPKELESRVFLAIYKYKDAIKLIDQLPYCEE